MHALGTLEEDIMHTRTAARLAGIAALIAAALPVLSTAQQYPAKPIRILIASSAGGYIDRTARLIGDKLAQRVGQSVVPENRGGAGGNIAAKATADASPDGYTLLATSTQITVNATLYKEPGFNVTSDLVPVALAGSTPGVFSVHPSNPARNLRDLIQNAQGKRLTHGSGVGTSSHIAADYLFRILARLDAVHVPFKGGAPATTAVLGNQVEVLNGSLGTALPYVRQGRLRALAVAGPKRDPALPDVPTVAESGFPGFQELSWVAFFGPVKTPGPVVNRLNAEINQILALPDISKALVELGMDITPGSPAEIADFVRKELATWTRIVKETGASVD
jgi:tripartite-type tricarboxylate transporter receptor subunit TctC